MKYIDKVKARFKANIILASMGSAGQRLYTVALTYPRFILAEWNTHRELSRNTSSSRAIPTEKLIDMVRDCPAGPVEWGRNMPGMQAKELLTEADVVEAQGAWLNAAHNATKTAHEMHKLGVHKQIVNRVLEPFLWTTQLITMTNWSNIKALRLHKDAQPEFRFIAQLLDDELNKPDLLIQKLEPGQWHLPYVRATDIANLMARTKAVFPLWSNVRQEAHVLDLARKVSAARCARVSYLTHDGKEPSLDADLTLFDRLAGSVPLHASPLEHQCMPDVKQVIEGGPFTYESWSNKHLHGNLPGWIQFRKMVPGEYVH